MGCKGEGNKVDTGRGGNIGDENRPGVGQVPEGSGEQGKLEKTNWL